MLLEKGRSPKREGTYLTGKYEGVYNVNKVVKPKCLIVGRGRYRNLKPTRSKEELFSNK